MTYGDTLQKKYLQNEWTLSLEEEKMLGEEHVSEYYQKVGEYSDERIVKACMNTTIVGLFSLFAAGAIALGVHVVVIDDMALSQSANLIIGLSIVFSITAAAVALTALISSKAEVPGMQNPKDWKKEILGQKTSKTESSYGTFEHIV